MDEQTIKKLNSLNKSFYQKVSEEFSRSRSYYWSGWQKLIPHINILIAQRKKVKVLDVGCGNSRFGLFLSENIKNCEIDYKGIDFDSKLLKIARDKISGSCIEFKFEKVDIVKKIMNNDFLKEKYDLLAAFGLFHHIPSFKLRRKLLKLMAEHTFKNGLLIFTFWQFADKSRFQKKIVNSEKIGVSSNKLQENDFILDWQRGAKAFRYCHHVDQPEMERLVDSSGMRIIDNYLADGKSENLNRYLILKG